MGWSLQLILVFTPKTKIMGNLTESKKRDFVKQMIVLMTNNTQVLTDAGYDPTAKVTELQGQSDAAGQAEVAQQEAMAKYKEATTASQEALDAAYRNASATVDLIAGLLGKNNTLVLELKKMRK